MQKRNMEIRTELTEDKIRTGNPLRPTALSEYVGQKKIKEELSVYIEAANYRGDCLDHILLYGPPGLGKTTLAGIIANEMGSSIKITSGPAIEKPGELAAILSGLQKGDVLFVDEIHRLSRQVEEVLYPAMEDFAIDIMIGKGETAKSIRLELSKFTLVGATTRAGLLTAPLRDRFGAVMKMDYYTDSELAEIVTISSGRIGTGIEQDAAAEIAKRSRGTPRIANRLLRRVRDHAQVKGYAAITKKIADDALNLMDIDEIGLDQTDRNIMSAILERFGGGPVGLETLAAATGEDAGTIEDVYEPYLIMKGLLMRTPKGRTATENACLHFGIRPAESVYS